jgi:hypothetical protein
MNTPEEVQQWIVRTSLSYPAWGFRTLSVVSPEAAERVPVSAPHCPEHSQQEGAWELLRVVAYSLRQ